MEAEALLVVLVYGLLVTLVLCFVLIGFGYIWLRNYIEEVTAKIAEDEKFIKLMIQLYENEKEEP